MEARSGTIFAEPPNLLDAVVENHRETEDETLLLALEHFRSAQASVEDQVRKCQASYQAVLKAEVLHSLNEEKALSLGSAQSRAQTILAKAVIAACPRPFPTEDDWDQSSPIWSAMVGNVLVSVGPGYGHGKYPKDAIDAARNCDVLITNLRAIGGGH